MVSRRWFSPLFASAALVVLACGCSAVLGLGDLRDRDDRSDGSTSGETGPDADVNPDAVGASRASKVDLLFVVDNSASMTDKAEALGRSLDAFLRALGGAVSDVHVGVISTSLGSMGGDVCGAGAGDAARLSTKMLGAPEGTFPGLKDGVLAYDGTVPSLNELVGASIALIKGVGQGGCGLEAQLESAYRFLVQPDPWSTIRVANLVATLDGTDKEVLRQRKAFLRSDSLVLVILLTDEDDSAVDPRSLGGAGWAYANNAFPGSAVFRPDGKSTTAPRAASACASNPGSPECRSCACAVGDAACVAAVKADADCQINGGYYGPTEDSLNVRFFDMKRRFGVDPQFPIARYVDGFTKSRVPDRDGEHAMVDGRPGPYVGAPSCGNPLFAGTLPDPDADDLCALPAGTRGKELVVFAVLGGVPPLLASGPSPDWTSILGQNPDAYDRAGIDPHMIPSIAPRAALNSDHPPSATRGDNGTDPVHGREWDTSGDDLQFACTFELPKMRSCANADPSCDCSASSTKNPPLCGPDVSGEQVRAKGYPSHRELRVAKGLGARGIVGSVCPSPGSSDYGATMDRLLRAVQTKLKR